MTFEIIIISVAVLLPLVALAYPYVWGILLKAKMLKELREHARAQGFKYRRFYKNIFFVRNRSSKYDLIIYNDERLYAVKLWSSYFVRSELVINRDGRVFERRETSPVFDTSEKGKSIKYIKSFTHSVSRTSLPKRYTRGGRALEYTLLIYPSYRAISFYDGKRRIPLGTGDELFGKKLYSPSAFTTEITKNGISATENKRKKDESSQLEK